MKTNDKIKSKKIICLSCYGVGRRGNNICPVCDGYGFIIKKYNFTKSEYNGVVYKDEKIAEKAKELDELKKTGEIEGWRYKPTFILIPKFTKNNKTYLPIYFIPQFLVKWKNGEKEVFDFVPFETNLYKIKKKIFNYMYKDYKLTIFK